MFLNEYDEPPLEALTYLTAECNYGGRVTDDFDRRLILSLLHIFYCSPLINNDDYKFSTSGDYHVLPRGNYTDYLDYIRSFPITPHPEVFGLHENADITKDQQEVQLLLDSILLTLPRQVESGDKSSQDIIEELATDILSKLPLHFNLDEIETKFPVLYEESMNSVLVQEVIRFNRLLSVVKQTLVDIRKAIRGEVVMSAVLEDMFNSMMVGKVPSIWMSKSYTSLKPLASYINDLLTRLDFFKEWVYNGAPLVFWISGFYFTQSFLTGVLQNYARREKIPIDKLQFKFNVMEHKKYMTKKPINGAYIHGLYMAGARWDMEMNFIADSIPKLLHDLLPVIWLIPAYKDSSILSQRYACPVYKTSARRGVLSTTGHSTNYVLTIDLPSDKPATYWINRGVALLCQLDD